MALSDLFTAPSTNTLNVTVAPLDSLPINTPSSTPTETPSSSKTVTFTVILKNVPVDSTEKQVMKLCPSKPSSLRFRSVPLDRSSSSKEKTTKIPKKVAALQNSLIEGRKSKNCYVEFPLKENAQSCCSALNCFKYQDHILFAHLVSEDLSKNFKKCVFVGNLPHHTDENSLFDFFSSAGDVYDIRVNRDRDAVQCIGTAYVHFKSESSVPVALQLNGALFLQREIRVEKCLSKHQQRKNKSKSQEANKTNAQRRLGVATEDSDKKTKGRRFNNRSGEVAQQGIVKYNLKSKPGKASKKGTKKAKK
ncbi:hypothetical protein GEMRC1_005962 [Eukaryota sp. GEM-RC1]